MTDFALARRNMIDGQLRPNRVTNTQLLTVISDLPREQFLPAGLRSLAYADDDVPLGNGRYHLPDGSERFLVNQQFLLDYTQTLGAELHEPVKTTNVQNMRAMTTWCLRKIE